MKHASLIIHPAVPVNDCGDHHFAANFGGLGGTDMLLGTSDLHDQNTQDV